MVDCGFYCAKCWGNSIPEESFPRVAQLAQAKLDRYKRIYSVTAPNEDSEGMAVCAMADALYFFETAANTPQSASVGSVSSSQGTAVDISPRAQEKELYRCACLYLDIYRGCGGC